MMPIYFGKNAIDSERCVYVFAVIYHDSRSYVY